MEIQKYNNNQLAKFNKIELPQLRAEGGRRLNQIDQNEVYTNLRILIVSIFDYFNATYKINAIDMLISDILSDYYYMSEAEIVRALNDGRKARTKDTFGKFCCADVMGWVQAFDLKMDEVITEKRQNEKKTVTIKIENDEIIRNFTELGLKLQKEQRLKKIKQNEGGWEIEMLKRERDKIYHRALQELAESNLPDEERDLMHKRIRDFHTCFYLIKFVDKICRKQ